MEKFFQKNKEAFSLKTPSITNISEEIPHNFQIQTTPSGYPTLKIENQWIHSTYDPRKEGKTFAQKITKGSQVMVYGFGLGYHLESILDAIGPDGFLLTIELNPDLLSAAFSNRHLIPLATRKNFHLIFGSDENLVSSEVSKYMTHLENKIDRGKLEILIHSPSFKVAPKGFPKLTHSIETLLMERRVPAVFGDKEVENYFYNKPSFNHFLGVNSLFQKHSNQLGILVSAGPSLDGLIPYLSIFPKESILSCVDTALPIFKNAEISPHYIFTLDPQDISFDHFIDFNFEDSSLVFIPTANPRIVHNFSGNKFVAFKENHSSLKYEKNIAEEKGFTKAGGSVACLALETLIRMGCNPILLIGQDCAFPNQRNYSRNANNYDNQIKEVSQIETLQQFGTRKNKEVKMIEVPRYDGQNVITNTILYSYLRTLEQIIQSSPHTQIYSLCSHGAAIENVIPLGSINELMHFI